MRFFRKRQRLRSLSERECYTRLHGQRSDQVRLSSALRGDDGDPSRGNGDGVPDAPPPASGPDRERPALDLVFRHPRGGVTMTGEELRRDLLSRMAQRGRGS